MEEKNCINRAYCHCFLFELMYPIFFQILFFFHNFCVLLCVFDENVSSFAAARNHTENSIINSISFLQYFKPKAKKKKKWIMTYGIGGNLDLGRVTLSLPFTKVRVAH